MKTFVRAALLLRLQDTKPLSGLKKTVNYFILYGLLISTILYNTNVHAQTLPPDSVRVDSIDLAQQNRDDSLKKAGYKKSLFDSKVHYKAKDSILINIITKKVYLYGEAEVIYEKIDLKGSVITIDFVTKEIAADFTLDTTGKKIGQPKFTDGSQDIEAGRIAYNFDTKRAKISNLVMKEGEGIIYGSKVKKDEDNNIYVGDARYTTCDAEHPHFYIHSSKLKIVPGKQIVTGPANLVIADVPTPLWVPFGFFPVTKGRKSGIIMPGYGFSPGQGYFLRNGGYYFGISDYFDLALTGDAFTQGTWAGRASSTYAKRYKYSGNIQFAYANNQQGTPEDVDFTRTRNYNLIWNHQLDPKASPNTDFRANVNYQSPSYTELNSYNAPQIVQSQVNSSINYGKRLFGGKASLALTANASQNNQTKSVNLTLPQLTLNVPRIFPFKRKVQIGEKRWYEDIGINYSANAQNNINTFDSLLFREQTLREMQNGARHTMSMSTQFKVFKYFSLSPSLSANEYWYLQTTNKTYNADSNVVEIDTARGFARAADFRFSVNLGTMLYGTARFKKSKKLKAVRHVMTVNSGLGFQPDFSDEGFGIYKQVQTDSTGNNFETYSPFAGNIFEGPGRGRQGTVSLNLGNNFEAKWRKYNDTGYEDIKIKLIESLNVGTSYNFFADEFKLANISVNARTVLFKQLNIMFNGFQLDPYAYEDTGGFTPYRVNRFVVNETGQLARLTNGSIAVSTSINSTLFDGKKNEEAPQPGVNKLQRQALMANPFLTAYELAILSSMGDFVDFNVPWSLSLNYTYNFSRPFREKTESQNVTFSGDMNLTENWKIAFSSGYDFSRKEVNLTSIDFYRQLHCWEFRFSWIPVGPRQYFLFNLNVKSSILQDLKINRRRDWFDNN